MCTLSKKSGLDNLERELGYEFKDPSLLARAFRHASYVNERDNGDLGDNERFEFLGDAVLDLVISHILMVRFPDVHEGDLSRYRAMVVDEAGLFIVATGLGLGHYIMLGKGEEHSNGRTKPSILANTMEALLGAIYLDGGYNMAFEVIERLFSSSLQGIGTPEMAHDFKSRLQEFTQKFFKTIPKYRLVQEDGPPHDRRFLVELTHRGQVLAQGYGKSKKEAEQCAAREALLNLKVE
ncbi:MAG: ribonuclease III [Desulfatiglandaceae bacterium]|jgi:ribonuclease III